MLTMKAVTNIAKTVHYFSAEDEYYLKEGSSEWFGSGAEALGLTGEVNSKTFRELLGGKLPTGDRVSQQGVSGEKRRLGWDMTFSAPKSVSIQALVAGDRAVLDAHNKAVKATLALAEQMVEARYKSKGVTRRERSGNLTVATFQHELSRSADPQLHTHAIVMNLTQREDEKWRALSNEVIFKNQDLLTATYRAELASNLVEIGYEIRGTDKNGAFEIDHIPRELIEAFSTRSRAIEEALAVRGHTRETASLGLKQALTVATRASKSMLTHEEKLLLKESWLELVKQYGLDLSKHIPNQRVLETGNKQVDGPAVVTVETNPGGERQVPARGEGAHSVPSSDSVEPVSLIISEGEIKPAPNGAEASSTDQANRGTVVTSGTDIGGEPPMSRGSENSHSVPSSNGEPKTGHVTDANVQADNGSTTKHTDEKNIVRDEVKEAVKYAIEHLMERDEILTAKSIAQVALAYGMGKVRYGELSPAINIMVKDKIIVREETRYYHPQKNKVSLTIDQWSALKSREDNISLAMAKKIVIKNIKGHVLQPAESRYTTADQLKSNFRILAYEMNGRGKMTPLRNNAIALDGSYALLGNILHQDGSDLINLSKWKLSAEQEVVANQILSSKDQYQILQGAAGVGKSHVMKSIIQEGVDRGYKFITIAPYAKQVDRLKQDGIEAKTVSAFLVDKRVTLDHNTVLVLDEAGLVPTRQMDLLMEKVAASGGRMILSGDVMQLKAVEAGKPFSLLQLNGADVTELDKIIRQKNPELLHAVELSYEGKVKESLASISARVTELPFPEQRHAQISTKYAQLSPEERAKTLVVTGTNESRKQLSAQIRKAIGIEGKGKDVRVYERVDTTAAQRRQASTYKVGYHIVSEVENPKFPRGIPFEVKDIHSGNEISLHNPEYGDFRVNASTFKNISVYAVEKLEFAVGDAVRITKNNASLDVVNGDAYTVTAVAKNSLELTNSHGRKVNYDLEDTFKGQYLDHGYVSTVHSAQGQTMDRAFIEVDTKSRTTAMDNFYVAISRARMEVSIVTNSLEELPKSISRANNKGSSVDLEISSKLDTYEQSLTSKYRDQLYSKTMDRSRRELGFTVYRPIDYQLDKGPVRNNMRFHEASINSRRIGRMQSHERSGPEHEMSWN